MDGDAIWSMMIFLALIVLEAVMNGFLTALDEETGEAAEASSHGEEAAESALWRQQLKHRFRTSGVFRAAAQLTVSVIAVLIGGVILWGPWKEPFVQYIAGGVCLILFLFFGILLPSRLAGSFPNAWLKGTWRSATVLCVLLYPAAWVASLLTKVVLRLWGIDYDAQEDSVTEHEIITMVNEGHEQGVLEADEAEMITNIFEYGDKEAADIMTHRVAIHSLDGSQTLKEAVHEIAQSNNSRFPVYGEDIDDIIGVLHMKEALVALEQGENLSKQLKDIPGLLQTPVFIPETRNIDDLLRDMQSQKVHMVIVLDEYGQTSGLITMEDILEEIVGNIFDEYDSEEEWIRCQEDGTYIMSGMTPLEDVAELLKLDLSQEMEEFDTLNGFLVYRLDRIPSGDERPAVEVENYVFQVQSVTKAMIQSVHVYQKVVLEAESEEAAATEE